MTTSSRMLIERMLHNSANVMMRQREEANIPDYPLFTHEEIDRCGKRMIGLNFNQAKHFRGAKDEIEIVFHPAGHVAGAAAVELVYKHRAIFFTGDVLFTDQRTLKGARFPAGHFDTVITETTRGTTERPLGKSRSEEMIRLVASINDTIQRGGSFLIPVFALGRMQEVLTIIHDARKFGKLVDFPIFASGLGMDLADYFDEISRKTKHIQFNRGIIKDLKIKPTPRKPLSPVKTLVKTPSTSSAPACLSSARPATRWPPASSATPATRSASSDTAILKRPAGTPGFLARGHFCLQDRQRENEDQSPRGTLRTQRPRRPRGAGAVRRARPKPVASF